MPLQPVEQQPDFPALEQRVLARWRERDVFARSLEARSDGPLFSFYEGPPTANGRPGVHHVEARTFKDVFPRYRTMKGYRVPRKAGWDCHGIPVEIEVEKQLGFTRKSDIEAYGVAEFNAKCRESVQRYVEDWNRLTERIGFWVDLDDAYWTMNTSYVESVWWSLKRLWDEGLIYEGHRVVPYCPRCGTALSDHEVAQGYAQAVDPSVYVRFPLLDGKLAEQRASLLIWTTTPWTLISNTAVAIGKDIRYVLVEGPGEHGRLVMAADLVETVLGEGAEILSDVAFDDLVGSHYNAPFSYVLPEVPNEGWRSVTVADFVTTTDGTGIVHMAPAFGEDDMRVAREYDLPVVNPVDLEGNFDERVTPWAGQFVKAADAGIIEALRTAGVLLKSGEYTHTYPFCWRCKTPLLYYAKPSWYIATTKRKDALTTANAGVDWHPEHIRDGRYGDWLNNNIDWSLSRERYWGTPLPLWRCDEGHVTCVGSRAELGELAGTDLSELDPHRPYVDDITFDCQTCGEQARRVPEVIDAWYDSGSMPFGQFGYPHVEGSVELFKERFPADFICEAIDQTRGWFYSLMAVSTLLFEGENSYSTVLCLGHIVDTDGRKMSKSVGNILDPWELVDSRGADALRWLLLTEGSPWVARRVGTQLLDEVVRKFLLTVWNTYYFFTTYALIDGWSPQTSQAVSVTDRPVMDRWILAELAETVRIVDAGLETFDSTTAGKAIATFVDNLSNWYVRRSRSRFWAADDGTQAAEGGSPSLGTQAAEGGSPSLGTQAAEGGSPSLGTQAAEGGSPSLGTQAAEGGSAISTDKDAAFATLHECLVTLTALLAPFTPFVADELYDNLVGSVDDGAPDSVHLLDFPVPDPEAVDDDLRAAMTGARRIVELGRRARNDAKIGVRQPLHRALVNLPADERAAWAAVADVVASELNVKQMDVAEGSEGTVTYRLKPNFRALGPTFGKRTPVVAAAIEAADAAAVAAALRDEGTAQVEVEGETVSVAADQVQVIEESSTGWQSASDGPHGVALDLTIDDALRREGLARETVRALNDLRKRRGLALSDRVRLRLGASGELAEALREHAATISAEVLAVELNVVDGADGEFLDVGNGQSVVVTLEVAPA